MKDTKDLENKAEKPSETKEKPAPKPEPKGNAGFGDK